MGYCLLKGLQLLASSLPSIFTQVTHLPISLSSHLSLAHAICLAAYVIVLFFCHVLVLCLCSFIFTLLWHISHSHPERLAFIYILMSSSTPSIDAPIYLSILFILHATLLTFFMSGRMHPSLDILPFLFLY